MQLGGDSGNVVLAEAPGGFGAMVVDEAQGGDEWVENGINKWDMVVLG